MAGEGLKSLKTPEVGYHSYVSVQVQEHWPFTSIRRYKVAGDLLTLVS